MRGIAPRERFRKRTLTIGTVWTGKIHDFRSVCRKGRARHHKKDPEQNLSSPAASQKRARLGKDPCGARGVSACLIVRDEETRLGRCLSSLAPWVEEICVVDTGSTDRTVEIATKFGAKVKQI
ncbi:MAG: glycosyltransferase, partial [Planctomycetota bacterium]